MTKCPECGTPAEIPYKTWTVSRKTLKTGGSTKIVFGMFECPECGNRFRAGAKGAQKKEVNIKGVAEKIKDVEVELVNTLKSLREKIKTLEAERGNLLLEIEELKKMAEGKANALESEIGMLREEVKSLKHLLGVGQIDA